MLKICLSTLGKSKLVTFLLPDVMMGVLDDFLGFHPVPRVLTYQVLKSLVLRFVPILQQFDCCIVVCPFKINYKKFYISIEPKLLGVCEGFNISDVSIEIS